jgi:hypothetical protein
MLVISSGKLTLDVWRNVLSHAGTDATGASLYFADAPDNFLIQPGHPNYLKKEFQELLGSAIDTTTSFALTSEAGEHFWELIKACVPGNGSSLFAWDVCKGDEVLIAVRDMSDVFISEQWETRVHSELIVDHVEGVHN